MAWILAARVDGLTTANSPSPAHCDSHARTFAHPQTCANTQMARTHTHTGFFGKILRKRLRCSVHRTWHFLHRDWRLRGRGDRQAGCSWCR